MKAKELDQMVKAMRAGGYELKSRTELEHMVFYLWKGVRVLGKEDLAEQLNELYCDIDGIDTDELIKVGTFLD